MNNTVVEVYLDSDELDEVKSLCLFYGTNSYMGLVGAMAKSIERLQERLHKETNPLYARNVRYG